mgnify:CR=1 FL=1
MNTFRNILDGDDNLNRIGDRVNKLATALGIDISDPTNFAQLQFIYAAIKKQHEMTKKNVIRYLKNEHYNVLDDKVFDILKKLPITEYVALNCDIDKYLRHQRTNEKAYTRKGTIPLEYVHDMVGYSDKLGSYGIEYNIKSPRFQLYKESTKCVHCGIEGEYYALEHTAKCKDKKNPDWHLNLYGTKMVDGRAFEVMITQDHIIPKSKGGIHHVSNLQTMCSLCNKAKDSINDEIFKNGNSKVTFQNINRVAGQYGIKLEQGDNVLFWSGSDVNPNMNIHKVPNRKLVYSGILGVSWVRWMTEIEEIVKQLQKVTNGN